MSAKRCLVTGGAGFIGSHVADALLEQGHHPSIIDDLSSGSEDNVPAQADFHALDIRSPEVGALVSEGEFDVLIHHAAQMDVRRSTEDPSFDASVNILGTLNLLGAACEAGVQQVVFASTGGAIYGEQDVFPASEEHPTRPLSPYGVAKLAGERYLYYFHAEHGLNATCLRYANVYGERQNPHGEAGVVAIFLQCTINGDGLQTRDYIHVSDVVAANLGVLGRQGFNIFNVGTGIESSVVDIYSGLTAALDSDVEAVHGPPKPGEQRRSCVDASRLRRELGLTKLIPLDEGLRRTAEWFSQRAGTRSD